MDTDSGRSVTTTDTDLLPRASSMNVSHGELVRMQRRCALTQTCPRSSHRPQRLAHTLRTPDAFPSLISHHRKHQEQQRLRRCRDGHSPLAPASDPPGNVWREPSLAPQKSLLEQTPISGSSPASLQRRCKSEREPPGDCLFDHLHIRRKVDRRVGQLAFDLLQSAFVIAHLEAGKFQPMCS